MFVFQCSASKLQNVKEQVPIMMSYLTDIFSGKSNGTTLHVIGKNKSDSILDLFFLPLYSIAFSIS